MSIYDSRTNGLIDMMKLRSVTFTETWVDIYNGLHKFIGKIFKDERVKSYKIAKVYKCDYIEKDIVIDVKYTSESGKNEMLILANPVDLIKGYTLESQINIYKNQLK